MTHLSQAAEHQREAIAFVAGVDLSEVEVEVHPDIEIALLELLASARAQRADAYALAANAFANFRKVAQCCKVRVTPCETSALC